MFGSTNSSSSGRIERIKREVLNGNNSNGIFVKNNTNSVQEEFQALRRSRNQGYVLPLKITQRLVANINPEPTSNLMELFYNNNDIYKYNVKDMDLLGTIYYKLPEEIYGSEYLNNITYIPFVGVDSPYCGCGPVITTDSTYQIPYSHNIIWFDAIRTPSGTNEWKNIPACFYETANYTSDQGNFFAKSIYFDEGITSTTEVTQEDFYIDFANGIYSGAKVVRFLYDNDNYTREVQIYGYTER